ncbi:MAG: GyrI-like domain-containing protein [Oscillospiraceae bacterium]|nr:GyrI-like domain-containing protein [Oscillospiraceae bacterium]
MKKKIIIILLLLVAFAIIFIACDGTSNQSGVTANIADIINNLSEPENNIVLINLPSSTVASIRVVDGSGSESAAFEIVQQFITDVELFEIYPDTRIFGFNHADGDTHGYEVWVTIPNDLEVPYPLSRKTFAGGLYASYRSQPVDFEDWYTVWNWVHGHTQLEHDRREPFGMNSLLEEHVYTYERRPFELEYVNLLVPIRHR